MKARIMESTVATLLFLAAAQPLLGQDAIPMRLNPADGSESRYRIEFDISLEGPMSPSAEPMVTANILLTKTFHRRNGGAIEVGASVDSSTITRRGLGQQMPDLNLHGATYTVTLDGRGRPTGEAAIETSTEDSRQFLGAMVTHYLVLPENQVEPGDSWAGTVETLLPTGSAEVELSYTLVEARENIAEIAYEGGLDLSGVAGISGAATLAGTVSFDRARGLILHERAALEVAGNAGGMNVMMKVNRVTNIAG